jgi:O-antigen ligase
MIIIFYRQILNGFSFAAISNAVGFLYLNHVEYAAVISIFFPLFFVTYIATAGMNKYIRLLLLSALCFFLIAVFFSYARAAIAAIIFSLLIGSAVRKRKVNFIMPVFYAVIAIVLFVLANDKKYLGLRPDYRHTFMHSGYADHIKATLEGRDVSSMERLYRWVAAIRMSNDRPITGFGPHGFVYHYKEYALPIFKTYSSTNKEHSTTHNYFLYMLTEQGWPAMLLYAILIMVVFYQAQNTYHRFNDRFYKYCTLGLVMAFAAAFVNNFFSELIETHKVGALFYLILSLLIVLDKKSREPVNL